MPTDLKGARGTKWQRPHSYGRQSGYGPEEHSNATEHAEDYDLGTLKEGHPPPPLVISRVIRTLHYRLEGSLN